MINNNTIKPFVKRETIENPLIGDKVTFIRSAAETNDEYTEVEVTLMPGGGNTHHYHTSFSETFQPIEGELTIGAGKQVKRYSPGDTVTANPMVSHFFANKTDKAIRFKVTLKPGNVGFEEGLRIAYGLARDGETTKKGIPKKIDHLAILLFHTDTNMYGIFTWMVPILRIVYKRAIKKGVLKELRAKYCR